LLRVDSSVRGEGPTIDFATKFGIELGSALRLFLKSYDAESTYRDIIYGLILAEIEGSSDILSDHKEEYNDLLEEISKKYNARREIVNMNLDIIEKVEELVERRRNTAQSLLLDNNIKPTESKLKLLQHIPEDELPDVVSNKKHSLKLISLIETSLQSDIKYISNKNLSGVTAETLLDSLFRVYHENKIKESEELDIRPVKDDDSVFKTAQDIPTYPIDIAPFNNNFEVMQQNITRALRILENEYGYTGTENPKYNITRETENGWELTGYGKLIAISRIEEIYSFMYRYILDQSAIESKLRKSILIETLGEILMVEIEEIEDRNEAQELLRLRSLEEIIQDNKISHMGSLKSDI
jgi:hypothetical protein